MFTLPAKKILGCTMKFLDEYILLGERRDIFAQGAHPAFGEIVGPERGVGLQGKRTRAENWRVYGCNCRV